jgi:hypothetical protein
LGAQEYEEAIRLANAAEQAARSAQDDARANAARQRAQADAERQKIQSLAAVPESESPLPAEAEPLRNSGPREF